ncbi:MAG: hypothetical protein GTN84_06520 [Hydrogenophaga sp.]|uniref:hypothetical protein n=1 Tax=Hydrogenophaga sp. TaxID=1904254 RepID=UPI0016AA1F2B|nr:hypothetical protein [Hydrogenophaga sp.]NIM40595.1 hypothetical protein [Hydrogenophaga sp.]NIN26070.1 hypothetical protein [Hydrogenophaga sp.]NIN30935.1 hypothetical protein [Hydrogenophaga sp.]NIN54978.1 hypothetical protein [Hydrogenophaga sp.]NIO51021.1 hypothetical protein [Hydrogenophaga sp.]
MKLLPLALALSALACPPVAVLAQTTNPKPASTAQEPTKKRAPLKRSAAKAVEEVTPIEEDSSVSLTEADLAVAQRVYVGKIPCELGAAVEITPARRQGFFFVQVDKPRQTRYYMHPVESRTGAIRLEDPKRGALWLQLGNKSMLMSQKLGRRVADECMSPEQVTFADEMKRNPPRSLLEPAEPGGVTPPATPAPPGS